MNRISVPFFLFCAVCFLSPLPATAVTIDMVTVGNPGNVADVAVMENDGTTGYGSVSYTYRMGKYDVTVGQYTAFLNAVAATDTYNLYNVAMASTPFNAGIAQSVSSPHTYSVIGSPNHPITFVSWGDAARFANWLHNGQPTGAQGAATTETGAYTLNGAISDDALLAVSRNAGAKWFIPSENEWYKAAYYDPVAGHYWNYATGTNTTPTSSPPGSTPNAANYYDIITGYAVTGSTSPNFVTYNFVTDVGAYTASASPYGTYDQSGDAFQWNEALIGYYRGLRGGSWNSYSFDLLSRARYADYPSDFRSKFVGFRVASLIPEPSTLLLAVLAAAGLLCGRRVGR